jgi:hypothetical protein
MRPSRRKVHARQSTLHKRRTSKGPLWARAEYPPLYWGGLFPDAYNNPLPALVGMAVRDCS